MNFENQPFDVIIQAGQSNADGTGIGDSKITFKQNSNFFYLNAEKTVEVVDDNLRITYLDKPFIISLADEHLNENGEKIADFALTFGTEYVKNLLASNRKLLVIRAGVGGSGFMKRHWRVGDILYNKLIELTNYALKLNPNNKIKALLWHQGEHDAFEKNPPEKFYNELYEMFSNFRNLYGNIPIIAADFCANHKNKNINDYAPIVEKIKAVLQELGNSSFIETNDLKSNHEKTGNGDEIHFCRESLFELGYRYYDKFLSLTQNNTTFF